MKRLLFFIFPLVIILEFVATPVIYGAETQLQIIDGKCGSESETDNYGFSFDHEQPHWTVNGQRYVSQSTIDRIDEILDNSYDDSIADVMILFLPEEEVGLRVNCAVHFLRYMGLGWPDGPRKDNGFTFVIVVENDGNIDVRYGVGLGLPALTAQGLTPINRLAENTYAKTGSMDKALLALIGGSDEVVGFDEITGSEDVPGFDDYARSKYEPRYFTDAETEEYTSGSNSSSSQNQSDASGIGLLTICCIAGIALLLLTFVVIVLMKSSGSGRSLGSRAKSRTRKKTTSTNSTKRSRRRSSSSRPSSSRPSRSRSGRGSGRSGRGN